MAPTVRSFSAEFEPLGLIGRYPDRYPGLLESGAPLGPAAGGARFDILPIASSEVLRLSAGGRITGPHARGAHGFLAALEAWWSALETPAQSCALPFTGGWLVYLGYEIAAEIEPSLALPASADSTAALAIRAPAAWVRDRQSGRAWILAEPGHERLLDRFAEDAAQAGAGMAGPAAFQIEEEEPARFESAVRRALEYIAAGDVYQANLSRCWKARAHGRLDPAALYRRLRAANPSPFAALLRDGDFAVVSSSPERLVSVRADIVSTRPIAGTRPRGASPESDAALIESLLGNEKERAEHVMLIDLERNDLGKICIGGSVQVDEFMAVETYAHVHHIVSNVSGRKLEGVSPIQIVRALFPGGTITGCPKVRCMQIIAELEAGGRGAYTGAIGYLNRDGSCDFNILIRTMTVQGAALSFRAGAGIVADSNPAHELAETRAKAEGLLRALRAGAGA
ncbi:MAG TPA: aminodeoxychorismate synthase component I [Steroidobacteraceae bacterium]|nr:aminodeoxychorismate synthase component I [Steroidobacteraceae bacterium]